MPTDLPSPWGEFLSEVDHALAQPTALHCLGGFVLAAQYGLPRPTRDVDYIEVVPAVQREVLDVVAGPDSALAKKYGVHVQYVTVASLADRYEDRLTELVAGRFVRLRLFVLDPYDLALSKLARNSPVDREDVALLVRTVPLRADRLRTRYHEELRPIILGDPTWHDHTLEMWIEAYVS